MPPTMNPPSVKELDEPKLEAIIETMFLAAFADGEFSEVERTHFTASIESLTDRRISGATLDALMVRMRADLDASGQAARLAIVKEQLTTPGARRAALSLTIQLVAADGIIRTSEYELILAVADALEIDRDEAADLVKELTSPLKVEGS
jgi:uncharacterized tellurite resistance protein B-like protein